MKEIAFVVPGRPVPAVRMTQRGKWVKFNAQRYLAYKQQIGWEARKAMGHREPLEGPIGVEVTAVISGGRPGDVDNIAKAILDGCNGVVWEDDRQVVALHVYRQQGRPQRAEIRVWPIEVVTEGNI